METRQIVQRIFHTLAGLTYIKKSGSENKNHVFYSPCFIMVLFFTLIAMSCNSPAAKSTNSIVNTLQNENELYVEIEDPSKYLMEFESFKTLSEIRISRTEKIISAFQDKLAMPKNKLDTSLKKTVDLLKFKNKKVATTLKSTPNIASKQEWESLKMKIDKEIENVEVEVKNLKTARIY